MEYFMSPRYSRISLLILSTATSFVACVSPTQTPVPLLVVSVGANVSTTGAVVPFDFGSTILTTTKTQIFTLTNAGNAPATLPSVSAADLKLAAPFSLEATVAANSIQPCASGMVLPASGGSCLFTVGFSPMTETSFSDSIQVTYTDGTSSSSITAGIQVFGQGKLDCSVDPQLIASKSNGTQAANDQMALDAARGTADGAALTPGTGLQDGYTQGYNDTYTHAYNSQAGYPSGYNSGYSDGLNRGMNDQATCNNGADVGNRQGTTTGNTDGGHDGYNDGYKSGYASGSSSGYTDGYNNGAYFGSQDGSNSGTTTGAADGRAAGYAYGYPQGQSDGYPIGYTDGANACTPAAAAPLARSQDKSVRPTADVSTLTTACYNQGYNATYSTSAYTNAYEAAKNSNLGYTTQYAVGYKNGQSAAQSDGVSKGHSDGIAAGEIDGFAAGSAPLYTQCFNTAYNSSYQAAYYDSYNANYNVGVSHGLTDGRADGYPRGQSEGYTAGYNANYNPAYNAQYPAAYNAGDTAGYTDGYNFGYSQGFTDGERATCGTSVTSAASSQSRIMAARQTHTVVVPAVVAPSAPASAPQAKMVLMKAPSTKLFGQGQPWFKVSADHVDQMLNGSTFVASKLPQSLLSILSAEEFKSLNDMRDAKVQGSLRSLLKQIGDTTRRMN
jgi:flagellar biosynthesis/type III secretory pathway protein FliH